MTIATNHPTLAAVPSVDDSAVADVTTLLPAREAVLARLAEQLTATDGTPAATLLIIGLLRRDDGWPTPAVTIAQVTMLLARSLRGGVGADLTAGEALRRATLSLTAARRVGPGGVVQLRGPA